MTDMRFVLEARRDWAGPQAHDQQEVLKRAVAKMVMLGEQVGVSTDQMVLLLNSGLTVRELLGYLLSQKTDLA
jgi:hypothetical protein